MDSNLLINALVIFLFEIQYSVFITCAYILKLISFEIGINNRFETINDHKLCLASHRVIRYLIVSGAM